MLQVLTILLVAGSGNLAAAAHDIAEAQNFEESDVFDRLVLVSGFAGTLSYSAVNGMTGTDLVTGLVFDFNTTPLGDQTFQYGLSTGLLFSPVSTADSGGALVLPLLGYAGVKAVNALLLRAHVGGNAVFQGSDAGLRLGPRTTGAELRGAAGLGLAVAISRDFAISARTDWTLVGEKAPFMAVIGLSFALGG